MPLADGPWHMPLQRVQHMSSQHDQTNQAGCFPAAAHEPRLLIHQARSHRTSLSPFIRSYIQHPTLIYSTLPSIQGPQKVLPSL